MSYSCQGQKYEYDGEQDYYNNSVDQSSGSLTMRATFPNPDGKLINGDYGSVFIYTNNKIEAPVVPQTAVLENPQGKYVYKLNEKDLPQIVYIQTQGQDNGRYIVDSGIEVGDRIIVGGLQKVIPNKPVRIVNSAELIEIEANEKLNKEKKDK